MIHVDLSRYPEVTVFLMLLFLYGILLTSYFVIYKPLEKGLSNWEKKSIESVAGKDN